MSKHIRNADGLSHERLYRIYNGMINRCLNPKTDNYKNYGGRSITVCDEWLYNYRVFREWALSNGYEDHLTIDRINNDGNYEPNNCRWATASEQNRNRRYLRHGGYKHNWSINGDTKSAEEWCEVYNVSVPTVMYRINKMHMSPQEALELGSKGRKNNMGIRTKDVEQMRECGTSIGTIATRLQCSETTVRRRLGVE